MAASALSLTHKASAFPEIDPVHPYFPLSKSFPWKGHLTVSYKNKQTKQQQQQNPQQAYKKNSRPLEPLRKYHGGLMFLNLSLHSFL